MRVLYVLNSFPKLSETFILNEIIELKNRNIDVEILALKNPQESVINSDILDHGLLKKTRYFLEPSRAAVIYHSCLSLAFYRILFNTYKEYGSSVDIKHIVRLAYHSTRYEGIDLIHAHFAYHAAVIGMQIGRILKKPFTFTAHAYEIFNKSLHSRDRLKTLSETADRIFTPSAFNKKYIVGETGVPEEKIGVIRATIAYDKFNETKRSNLSLDKIKIISIGRLVEKKGFQYLIKSLEIVKKKHSSIELVLIGEGPLKDELVSLSKDLGLDNNIKFLGARSNEECIREISESDIAVLPCVVASNGDMDALPLALQEAMATGIPAISSRIGGMAEIIEDGKEGILVPERDERALADAILQLIENPAMRNEMGRNGRVKIAREFNQIVQADKLIRYWREILDIRPQINDRSEDK